MEGQIHIPIQDVRSRLMGMATSVDSGVNFSLKIKLVSDHKVESLIYAKLYRRGLKKEL